MELLLLALGCSGKETTSAPETETDGTEQTETTLPSDSGDTGDPKPVEVETFDPYYVTLSGFFGYDPELDAAVPYTYAGGARVRPVITARLFEVDFVLNGDYAHHACGVQLVMKPEIDSLPAETWSWTQGSTEHVHRGFRFPAGAFDASDWDDDSVGMLGCSRHDFDPATFPEGLFTALEARDWGVGFGTVDADFVADLRRDSAYDGTVALLDEGSLAGGSILTGAAPPYDPRFFVRANGLDESGELDPEVVLTAEQMMPATGLPAAGAYVLFPPNWISFSALWGAG